MPAGVRKVRDGDKVLGVILTFRCDEAVERELRALAREEDRPLSAQVRILLEAGLTVAREVRRGSTA
jgi:hypothetical protein